MTEYSLKYRNWLHGQPPKRIKLDIGGWAGENTWKTPQPWHCKPWSTFATYSLELIYTWQTTCIVSCDENGVSTFEGDFTQEKPDYLKKEWYPFSSFAPYHFGYVSMVDIQTPPEHNLLVSPHPRFYADRDGSTPCAIPGALEMDYWPEIFFIVFKAPLPGKKLIFKHGDPIAQFSVVPRNIKYDIKAMTEDEAALRAQRQRNLEKNWNHLCTRIFHCEKGEFFDNKYKVLSAIASREGTEAAEKIMDNPELIPHWKDNPKVIDNRKDMNLLTNKQMEEMYDPELLKEVDNIIAKNVVAGKEITSEELQHLIASFKMSKRHKRQERSQKIRDKADPKLVEENQKQLHPKPPDEKKKKEGEYVLGYRKEKLL